jgi:hypothetical protein
MRYMVAHVINSPAGAVRSARLIIDDVPDKTTRGDVLDALTAHGDAARFSEAGVPFGNHEVIAEGRKGWAPGLAGIGEAPRMTWEQLTIAAPRNDVRRLTVRLSPAQYATIQLAAQRDAGGNLQQWSERVLTAAATSSAYGGMS